MYRGVRASSPHTAAERGDAFPIVRSWSTFLPIATDRLVLRRFRGDDAEVLAAYRSDPRRRAVPELDRAVSGRRGENADRRPVAARRADRGEWIQIAIERDGELVGDVAVGLSDDGLTATIGYTVAPAHQGGGLATEAVGAVVDRLFDELAVHRVAGVNRPPQRRLARVVERLGFVHEGTALASVLHHGDWADDARYALTADGHQAWRSRPTGPPVDVRLVEISAANVHDVLQLSTHPTQRRFVAPMAASFADAFAPEWIDGAPVVPWARAIEADGELVGFMMLADAHRCTSRGVPVAAAHRSAPSTARHRNERTEVAVRAAAGGWP